MKPTNAACVAMLAATVFIADCAPKSPGGSASAAAISREPFGAASDNTIEYKFSIK